MSSTALFDSLRFATLFSSPLRPSTFTPSINLTFSFLPSNRLTARISEQPCITASTTTITPPSGTYTLMLIDPKLAHSQALDRLTHSLVCTYRQHYSTRVHCCGRHVADTLAGAGAQGKDQSGLHRYLCLLFREPRGLTLGSEDVGGDEFVQRRSFSVSEWAGEKGLEVLGLQWMGG